jgi:hypothetical protein
MPSAILVSITDDLRFCPGRHSIEQSGKMLGAIWPGREGKLGLIGRDFALISPPSDRFSRNG